MRRDRTVRESNSESSGESKDESKEEDILLPRNESSGSPKSTRM